MTWGETGDGRTATVREADHTADVAIEVSARSLADLFAGAARGLAWLMAAGVLPASEEERRIEVEEADYESLLVAWLNALIGLNDDDGFIATRTKVTLEAGPRLMATVRGARAAEQKRHVKAATFHLLEVTRSGAVWSARVVFDV